MNNATALLINAATLAPQEALFAYKEWKNVQIFEKVEGVDFLLLPMVYKNIGNYLDDDWTPRIRGIYKLAWIDQQNRIKTEKDLADIPSYFVWREHAHQGFFTHSDLLAQGSLKNALAPFLGGAMHVSYAKQLWHWRTRGWVQVQDSVRVFRESSEIQLLHRLFGSTNSTIWLARSLKELREIAEWHALFQHAACLGLRLRLYHIISSAMHVGLLPNRELPSIFSGLDELRFQQYQTAARFKRLYISGNIGLRQLVPASKSL
jgi:hypothetical protein